MEPPAPVPRRYVPVPRLRAKFTIVIRDCVHGDRLQITVRDGPWGRHCADGRTITQLCNALRVLLTQAA